MKKKKAIILILVVSLLCTFIPAASFAEDESISVIYNGKTTTCSKTELSEIATAEGDTTYNYSGMNTYGNYKTTTAADINTPKGPTVIGVLKKANIDTDSLSDDTVITFKAKDGFAMSFLWKEIKEERYYYPNGSIGTAYGKKGTEESKNGRKTVPAIIDTENDDGVLRIGQLEPNEQSWPAGVKYMLGGTITVNSRAYSKITDKVTTSVNTGSQVMPGQIIKLIYPAKHFSKYIILLTERFRA